MAKFDAYPMSRVDEVVEQIGPATVMSTLDLAKGYWQIPLCDRACEKTAFTTPYGLYEFEVMPFGLHNTSTTFQRIIQHLLCGCERYAGAYIDDVVVLSVSWKEYLAHLREVLKRLRRAGLTLKR